MRLHLCNNVTTKYMFLLVGVNIRTSYAAKTSAYIQKYGELDNRIQ